jgi:hypothetical protein
MPPPPSPPSTIGCQYCESLTPAPYRWVRDEHPGEAVPLAEVWCEERKVTLYPDKIIRLWGSNADVQITETPYTLANYGEALKWLYRSPLRNDLEKVMRELYSGGHGFRVFRIGGIDFVELEQAVEAVNLSRAEKSL